MHKKYEVEENKKDVSSAIKEITEETNAQTFQKMKLRKIEDWFTKNEDLDFFSEFRHTIFQKRKTKNDAWDS